MGYNHTRPPPASLVISSTQRRSFALSQSPALITADHLGLKVAGRQLLRDISLQVRAGEITTVIGPNGAGKTSLLRLLLGLTPPTQGRVWRQPGLVLGYMPQRLHIDASMPMSVLRFLQLGQPRLSSAEAVASLQRVRAEQLLESSLAQLSGGEIQRVLLARAASRKPGLLVLDEPTQGVDLGGQAEVYQLIAALRDQLGCGVLLVSHDLHLVMAATDRVLCINQHICCQGLPDQVSRDPAYLALFGDKVVPYTHRHNHQHDISGDIVSCDHQHHSSEPTGKET
ncbi:ATP-binding cassette domain-containing protein [Microbulbifer sp. 2201CG32-9]|uniref:ATP-binding cassette domain-containing protein n=1 Tax=Microbulbifer sp. 2201CG32-9 TaxID=3232309 RepID=UPI00345BFE00